MLSDYMSEIRVQQLLKIICLELDIPLKTVRCLVLGESELSDGLAVVLSNMVLRCDRLPQSRRRYTLVILFEPINGETLTKLMAKNGLVIECFSPQREVVNEISSKDCFRRVRVVSLAIKG